jgi:hypothetical protein
MTRTNRTAATSSGRRKRDEEQLELDLSQPDGVAPATRDLRAAKRRPPASQMQTKRVRNGVLVQQMLK